MGTPKIFIVGRDNKSGKICHIFVPRDQMTVSRQHLELTVTEDGRYLVNDLDSASGTFVRRAHGKWERVGQAWVEPETIIRLGEYEVTVADLLGRVPPPPKPIPEKVRVTDNPRINPETGEVYYE